MGSFAWIFTNVSSVFQWIGERLAMIFVHWWREKMRRYVSDAVIASDYKVDLVTGVDPLKLRLQFKVHNGSTSDIQLKRVAVHLFCGDAHVGSVVGQVTENPFIKISFDPRIRRGKRAEVSIDFTPSIYLWFWLLSSGGFDLRSSVVEASTGWGDITVPLSENIHNNVKERIHDIDKFVESVREKLVIKK